MDIRVPQELKTTLLDKLSWLDLHFVYAYSINNAENKPYSLTIGIRCVGVSLTNLELLEPWGHFIVCPVNHETLELYTELPDDIEKCIIK